MSICHFYKVDLNNIEAKFTDDKRHRSTLKIPFQERSGELELCIVGQNPSNANEVEADKTLHYLERYVFEKLPQYSGITMLNLFSRVDTKKTEKEDLLRLECEREYRKIIDANTDFLIVFGLVRNEGAYNFKKRARFLKKHLHDKKVFKINIDTPYPPHPGNRKIYYGNYCFEISSYDFNDI